MSYAVTIGTETLKIFEPGLVTRPHVLHLD